MFSANANSLGVGECGAVWVWVKRVGSVVGGFVLLGGEGQDFGCVTSLGEWVHLALVGLVLYWLCFLFWGTVFLCCLGLFESGERVSFGCFE